MSQTRSTVYMPPKAEIVYLNDFKLEDLEKTFAPALFERKISPTKIGRIANAIMDNKFVDNTLRVVSGTEKVKYHIIDGQHRIAGLRYAREYYGLLAYDLILFIYTGGNQREIYRRLNLGKPLTLGDHLKALDTGRISYFNELREVCDHYNSVSKFRYAVVLNWLHYAKSTSIRPVRPVAVDDFIQGITSLDTKKVKLFVPVLYQIATNTESPFYRYTILRNFFRVYFENKVPDEKMIELGKLLLKSPKVIELAEKRDTFAMRGIYHYIIDIAAPKVGLDLTKGDVKK